MSIILVIIYLHAIIMPRGRPATHQSAEEKKAARSAENQRAYVKKKLKLISKKTYFRPIRPTEVTS